MAAPAFLLKHRLAHISSLSKPFQGLHILFQRKLKLFALQLCKTHPPVCAPPSDSQKLQLRKKIFALLCLENTSSFSPQGVQTSGPLHMQLTVFAELAPHHLKFEPPCPLLKKPVPDHPIRSFFSPALFSVTVSCSSLSQQLSQSDLFNLLILLTVPQLDRAPWAVMLMPVHRFLVGHAPALFYH